MRRVRSVVRGALSLVLFALFGVGGVLISPLALVLRSPRRCQPLVRALWIPLTGLFRLFGIIGIKSPEMRYLAKSYIKSAIRKIAYIYAVS